MRREEIVEKKEKIVLTPEQETLLIPLFAKANKKNPLFFDQKAKEILDSIEYDFEKLQVPYKTVILVCQRAKKMDTEVRNFLKRHPDGVVLHLGCGLDNRFWRVDNGRVKWYDLDMPPVVELRKQFYKPNNRYTLIASSVIDLAWVDKVSTGNKPVLVILEGLLMYLEEFDVKKLFLKLHEVFPGCRLTADAFSRMAARVANRHASLKYTGAKIGWGVDDPREIECWAPGIQLIEEWYFSQDPDLEKLSAGYRWAYKLAGLSKAARRAHRILILQL